MSKASDNLKDKLQELDELLAWFESDDLDIEEALEKYQKGSELASSIRERLGEIENKVTIIEKRFDQDAS